MDPQEGGDFALAETLEIVEGQAFILPGGEVPGHYSPHLAHFRADKASVFLPCFFLVAVVAGGRSGKNRLKNGGILADFLIA